MVCNKATIPHFTKDKLSTMPYIVFSVDEQKEIADYLDVKCAEIDNLISKKEQYITEIENYKKSLIYEYVTREKRRLTNLAKSNLEKAIEKANRKKQKASRTRCT